MTMENISPIPSIEKIASTPQIGSTAGFINNVAVPLYSESHKIERGLFLYLGTLGTASYVKIGTIDNQFITLRVAKTSLWITFVDDIHDIYAITDVASNGASFGWVI